MNQFKVFDSNSDMLHWLHIMTGNAMNFVLGTYHSLGEKHLQSYLDEFCYRFNYRYFQGEIFCRLLCAATSSHAFRLADLTL